MDLLYQGIKEAIILIFSGNSEIWQIVFLSLFVSLCATVISMFIGIGLGAIIGVSRFPSRRLIIAIINTGMGLPTVLVGLLVTLSFWRSGPMGFLNILYTPTAMIVAQVVIATPIIMGLTVSAIQSLPAEFKMQAFTLGASYPQMLWLLIKETRMLLVGAVIAGFGGVISEVGAVMATGGNIKGQTRTLTTAIMMGTRMGDFELAIALGIVLLLLIFLVNLVLTYLQQHSK